MIHENFIFLGFLLSVIGGTSYLIDTIKGKTKPNRLSFFIFALAPFIAVAAEIKKGVGLPVLMTFIVGFNPFLIFLASFINKKAYWKLSSFDLLCGGLSVFGLILWIIIGEGNLAIFFAILADGLAALPIVVKSWKAPETENYKLFLFAGMNAFITLLTVKTWDFAHYGFPVYILLICWILTILIKFEVGKRFAKAP